MEDYTTKLEMENRTLRNENKTLKDKVDKLTSIQASDPEPTGQDYAVIKLADSKLVEPIVRSEKGYAYTKNRLLHQIRYEILEKAGKHIQYPSTDDVLRGVLFLLIRSKGEEINEISKD